jgi:hypothetical protein
MESKLFERIILEEEFTQEYFKMKDLLSRFHYDPAYMPASTDLAAYYNKNNNKQVLLKKDGSFRIRTRGDRFWDEPKRGYGELRADLSAYQLDESAHGNTKTKQHPHGGTHKNSDGTYSNGKGHGKMSKKKADAQRKAMFANGYRG